MKCPHCDRIWKASDLDSIGMLPESMLRDHVQRFCPGSPTPMPAATTALRPHRHAQPGSGR